MHAPRWSEMRGRFCRGRGAYSVWGAGRTSFFGEQTRGLDWMDGRKKERKVSADRQEGRTKLDQSRPRKTKTAKRWRWLGRKRRENLDAKTVQRGVGALLNKRRSLGRQITPKERRWKRRRRVECRFRGGERGGG